MTRNDGTIHINDLRVSYGGHEALRGISVNLPEKAITAVIGPSGCGKSTLLKSINRLIDLNPEAAVSGEISVNGMRVLDRSLDVTRARREVGLLCQRPYPLPMSILENVAFGMRIHGLCPRRDIRHRVEHYLRLVGLWDEVQHRLDAPASRLSLGQQQRLCLARALALEPRVLLGDEPTSALDPVSALRVEDCLKELKSQYTVVIVTHILRQARRLADYVVFLYMGELVEHGPAAQVLGHPQEARTQAYVAGEFS